MVTLSDLKITKNKEESEKQNADVYEHTSSWKGQTIVNKKPQPNNNVSINDVYALILKMNDDMNEMKDDIKVLKEEMKEVKDNIKVLKEEQKKTNSRLENVEKDIKAIKNCPTIKKELKK